MALSLIWDKLAEINRTQKNPKIKFNPNAIQQIRKTMGT